MTNMTDTFTPPVKRVDLHCHSIASTEADEAALNAIGCPESYSEPADVHAQARSRGMDFVTITDHDSVDGVAKILDRPDVLPGEELTCYFPEDGCKMHVLVWGLTRDDHAALQAIAADIYDVARYVEERQLAHAVAHPVYRQNDVLERWHLERLIVLFKGFECLNGAHSAAHRDAFEPMIDSLTPETIELLARRHKLPVRWNQPWNKTRTGGSDDHALLNIGRTWTEFPADCRRVEDLLECLRTARCRPGGEAGSSIKLAHNFLGVAVRYASHRLQDATRPGDMLQMLVGGGRALRRRDLLAMAARQKLQTMRSRISRGFRKTPPPQGGIALFRRLFESSVKSRIAEQRDICDAIRSGRAPLAEHEAVFQLIGQLQRDVTQGISSSVFDGLSHGKLAPLFDAISAVAAQQFLMLPYYFALFHQNREREHLPRITGYGAGRQMRDLRVGVFTDAFDADGEIAQFTRSLAAQSHQRGLKMLVQTCSASNVPPEPWQKNFQPLTESALPFAGQSLSLPPVAEVLEWADRQQFDVIHAETCGPMGFVGWLAAKMLRIPFIAAFHVDMPGLVKAATGDFRLALAANSAAGWFYQQADVVITRSRSTAPLMRALGVEPGKLTMTPPEFDVAAFEPSPRDLNHWNRLRVGEPIQLLYRGPVAVERNVPMLADAFERLCRLRSDVALIVLGDGPYRPAMQKRLAPLPAYFPPPGSAASAAEDYCSSDLLLYPSHVECAAQTVIEAQACGLPVLVSDQGAAAEMMDDAVSGMVLPAHQPQAWADAIHALLNDEPRRQRMSRTAPQRATRFARRRTLDLLWDEYARLAAAHRERSIAPRPDSPITARVSTPDLEASPS